MPSNPFAFPQPVTVLQDGIYMPCEKHHDFAGMEIRDHFAGLALNGLICQNASPDSVTALAQTVAITGLKSVDVVAVSAYAYADAMLRAREKATT
jgi:hypothetical protein